MTSVRLETGLAARLKDYARFHETTPSDIISQALRHVMKTDREFHASAQRSGATKTNGGSKANSQ